MTTTTRSVRPTTARTVPRVVQAARALLAVEAVVHVVVAVVMAVRHDAVRATIAAAHPDYGTTELMHATTVAVGAAAVFHVVLAVLGVVLVVALGRPRRWARRVATVSQAATVVFGFVSWSSSPLFHAVVPVVDAIAVVVVVALWVPPVARRWFARR